jgi:hypothetical protein
VGNLGLLLLEHLLLTGGEEDVELSMAEDIL